MCGFSTKPAIGNWQNLYFYPYENLYTFTSKGRIESITTISNRYCLWQVGKSYWNCTFELFYCDNSEILLGKADCAAPIPLQSVLKRNHNMFPRRREHQEARFCQLLPWTELCPHVEALITNVSVSGDGAFKTVIKIKWDHKVGALIQ